MAAHCFLTLDNDKKEFEECVKMAGFYSAGHIQCTINIMNFILLLYISRFALKCTALHGKFKDAVGAIFYK